MTLGELLEHHLEFVNRRALFKLSVKELAVLTRTIPVAIAAQALITGV